MGQIVKNKMLVFCLLLAAIVGYAQPGTINSHNENSQLVRDFSGYQWKMKMMLPGEGVKQGLHQLPPEDIETHVWNPAKIPGDVYTDLWKAGVIEDPYYGRNSVKAQWVMQYEWWYSYQFNVTEDIGENMVRLDFDGVDYACDVWLNGEYLGSHEGAFSPFSFDINHALRTSKKWLKSSNILMVRLAPPPQVNSRVAGRKTPWFGDYWRDLIPFGLYRPIRMVTTGKARITDLYVKPKINKDKSAYANLEIEVENTASIPKQMSFVGTIEGKNFKSKEIKVEFSKLIKPGKQIVKKQVKINNAKLWWPWDLGEPNLYTAKISLKDHKINQDYNETTFGIREVSMKWNPGFTKDEVSFPRTTVINGKPIFIRSACWGGPPDIFVGRTTEEKYKRLIKLAKEANMNNIRIFGWHPPEIPIFYKLCDEAGITVWQDIIPLGTGNLSKDEAFLEKIFKEGESVITERRNHPSLIMMEGGEEMFLRSGDAMFTRNFLETLGKRLQAKVDLPYVPDSPLTCETAQEAGYKPKEAVHALRYFYGMGKQLMEDWYSSLDYPIVPEYAITSVPNVESLKKFIPKDELWTPGVSWGHHWADLDRLRIQNFDAFGEEKTGSLQEFVDATQDAQGIIFQLGIEHFRRRKPVTSGISLCHFITYWPDMKWGLVDNYTQPKRSYYFVKTAFQPLLINLKFDKRRWKTSENFKGDIWVVNDFYKEYKNCKATYIIKDDAKNVLFKKSFNIDEIGENSSTKVLEINQKILKRVKKNFYVTLELKDKKGNVISENDYMLLIGDQQKASAQFKKMGEEVRNRNRKYTYGNYYKFYDKYSGDNKEELESKLDTIKTRGFNK
ncbi:beta-mannosidase [Wenyingzhuangia heitensis]|uniref:Beta-mannosidase B n=1 Tax=Wenyingzhuangia heitensis TaxID=1487859 RepID=A0ABX0UAL5_9FLAO|nr:sugar-binding domain-containing protein [Wenyingzhuangia heitensis]NIJ45862.1 beta-mannosidase [Wenyingzhuangia heitensis]